MDDHDTTSVSDEPLGSHSVVDDYHHHHDDDDNAVDRHFADADNDMALPQDDYDEEDDGNDQPCGRKKKAQFRKSRDAPKRFKSPYICFFTAKQEEIREELGEKAPVTEIAKRSAERWKELSSEDRKYWIHIAEEDKERYLAEKAAYMGPWVESTKRKKKDLAAPKRPMSAFLHYSFDKRTAVREQHPGLKTTEISKLLGEMWKNAPDKERNDYLERERREREDYKIAMEEWKLGEEERKSKAMKLQMEQMEQLGLSWDNSSYRTNNPYHGFAARQLGPLNFPQLQTRSQQHLILGPNGMPLPIATQDHVEEEDAGFAPDRDEKAAHSLGTSTTEAMHMFEYPEKEQI